MDEQNYNDCSGGHFVVQDIAASPMGESLHKFDIKGDQTPPQLPLFAWTICDDLRGAGDQGEGPHHVLGVDLDFGLLNRGQKAPKLLDNSGGRPNWLRTDRLQETLQFPITPLTPKTR